VSEQTPEQERRSFGRLFDLLFPLVKAFYPMRCRGTENIPEGPAVVCANHSNYIDPLLVAAAFGKENYMHFMAKLELQRVPVVGAVLKKCGICFVDRGKSDIDAVRSMMRYLKRGEKVFIFPEGTRVEHDNEVEAKTGAVRIASKMKVPILPVYIPRGKKIFGRVELLVGKPYTVEGKTHEEYLRLADGVMERIYELRDGTNG
jgi:1-acyl-sn-glycerol-3-phosphate acyltransferase